jgi:hypothetical protein
MMGAGMVRLIADFEADWIASLRDHMIHAQRWNAAEVQSLEGQDVPTHIILSRCVAGWLCDLGS